MAGGLVDAPVAVGDSVVLGMLAQPRSGEVRLVNAEPVVTQNTSGATVRVLLCGDPSGVTANMTIGSERGRAELVCTTTAPPQDATLGRVVPRHPSLVIEVTPRAPGAVTINGLRVRYRTGFQQGVQESGLKVTVRTPVGAD